MLALSILLGLSSFFSLAASFFSFRGWLLFEKTLVPQLEKAKIPAKANKSELDELRARKDGEISTLQAEKAKTISESTKIAKDLEKAKSELEIALIQLSTKTRELAEAKKALGGSRVDGA